MQNLEPVQQSILPHSNNLAVTRNMQNQFLNWVDQKWKPIEDCHRFKIHTHNKFWGSKAITRHVQRQWFHWSIILMLLFSIYSTADFVTILLCIKFSSWKLNQEYCFCVLKRICQGKGRCGSIFPVWLQCNSMVFWKLFRGALTSFAECLFISVQWSPFAKEMCSHSYWFLQTEKWGSIVFCSLLSP